MLTIQVVVVVVAVAVAVAVAVLLLVLVFVLVLVLVVVVVVVVVLVVVNPWCTLSKPILLFVCSLVPLLTRFICSMFHELFLVSHEFNFRSAANFETEVLWSNFSCCFGFLAPEALLVDLLPRGADGVLEASKHDFFDQRISKIGTKMVHNFYVFLFHLYMFWSLLVKIGEDRDGSDWISFSIGKNGCSQKAVFSSKVCEGSACFRAGRISTFFVARSFAPCWEKMNWWKANRSPSPLAFGGHGSSDCSFQHWEHSKLGESEIFIPSKVIFEEKKHWVETVIYFLVVFYSMHGLLHYTLLAHVERHTTIGSGLCSRWFIFQYTSARFCWFQVYLLYLLVNWFTKQTVKRYLFHT